MKRCKDITKKTDKDSIIEMNLSVFLNNKLYKKAQKAAKKHQMSLDDFVYGALKEYIKNEQK